MRTIIALATMALATSPAIAAPLNLVSPTVETSVAHPHIMQINFVTKAKDMPGTRVMDRNGRDLGFVQYVQSSETLRIQFRGGDVRDVPARLLKVRERFNLRGEGREFQVIYTGR